MRHRVPCAPVRDLDEVVDDPHLHARGMLPRGRATRSSATSSCRPSPLRFGGETIDELRPSKRLGADNAAVSATGSGLSRGGVRATSSARGRSDGAAARHRRHRPHRLRQAARAHDGLAERRGLPQRAGGRRRSRRTRSTRSSSRCRPRKVEMMYGQKLAEALGLQPRIGGVWDQGGASNISMIAIAAMAIEAGQCEVALVYARRQPAHRHAPGLREGRAATTPPTAGSSVAAGYAMIARRHMHDYGTTTEQLRRDRGGRPRARRGATRTRSSSVPLDRRDLRRRALGRRAAAARRLLPGLRRRRGGGGDVAKRRARELGVADAGADPRLRPGQHLVGRGAAPRPDADQGRRVGADRVRDGRPEAGRHRRRADLRLLHDHRR